mmetsp:Transcript_126658/g.405545  ORF Transcript_126658/g.405545 Transcript_126658/m.405545 type:complete len:225 (-) Transcript_126658:3734-4408(-)
MACRASLRFLHPSGASCCSTSDMSHGSSLEAVSAKSTVTMALECCNATWRTARAPPQPWWTKKSCEWPETNESSSRMASTVPTACGISPSTRSSTTATPLSMQDLSRSSSREGRSVERSISTPRSDDLSNWPMSQPRASLSGSTIKRTRRDCKQMLAVSGMRRPTSESSSLPRAARPPLVLVAAKKSKIPPTSSASSMGKWWLLQMSPHCLSKWSRSCAAKDPV